MLPSASTRLFSRRGVLGLTTGLALGTLTGCSIPSEPGAGSYDDRSSDPEPARCVARDTLDDHRSLAGAPLLYEPNGRRSTFWFDPAFYARLEAWAGSLTGTWGSEVETWSTYGSWTNGGSTCDSWHNSGRAFDLARVRLTDGTTISCRHDRWSSDDPAALTRSRRAYWSLAAGLHQDFAYVLTYLYDAAHANHIHIDNSRSGSGVSQFSTRSRVQVQAVQAIATYLWDEPVELTGRWDPSTRSASERILGQIGRDGSVADGAALWQAFLGASAVRGRS